MRPSLRSRLLLPALLALAALAPAPAQAMILPGAGSKEADAELAAKAHQAGRELTGVLLVAVQSGGEDGKVSYGSGIYLGPAKDGRTGLVLTAAHVLLGSEVPLKSAVTSALLFGRVGKDEEGLAVPVTRVVVHPHLLKLEAAAASGAVPRLQVEHDLAVLEFDLASYGKELERMGVRPLPLCEGKDHQAPLLDARVAGFGQLGHAGGSELADLRLVHAGRTRVSYLKVDGEQGFHAWTPLKDWPADQGMVLQPGLEAASLDLEPKESKYHRPGHGLVRVKVQEQQAVGTAGDSGGPLLISGPDQTLQLLGVLSNTRVEQMVHTRTGAQEWLHRQFFAAIPDNLDWIRGIQAGEYGTSALMTAGKQAGKGQEGTFESKLQAGADAGAGQVERKVERKGENSQS